LLISLGRYQTLPAFEMSKKQYTLCLTMIVSRGPNLG